MTAEADRCERCGRLFSRPSFYRPCSRHHPVATPAQRIADAIERDLSDRRGLRQEWEGIDDEIRDEIRDKWAALVEKELGK